MLDPLHDPLKDNVVVPQKYVDALKEQGFVKVLRCKDCEWWDTEWPNDEKRGFCHNIHQETGPSFFCAEGKEKRRIR